MMACMACWPGYRILQGTDVMLVAVPQVKLGKVLGEGTFGTTYMGRWRGGGVAVKCVHIQQRDEAESFLREVHVLACVRHPNVMPFYGAFCMPCACTCLVLTYPTCTKSSRTLKTRSIKLHPAASPHYPRQFLLSPRMSSGN